MPSRFIENSVRLHVNNLFHFYHKLKYGNFKEFQKIRNIFREAGLEFHKPIDKSAVECCLPIKVLKELFKTSIYSIFEDAGGVENGDEEEYTCDRKLMNDVIRGITNEDLENFRLQTLEFYKIKYCDCGCTALSMDTDEIQNPLSLIKWGWVHHSAAMIICAEKKTMQT